ncbi:DUF3592 domain-containing protein [Microlunatus flavus]|uniref:DUF3592 domain-containing protein n=1 Tax=Microlunatus flavus TaxID=1036181 RepID=A0A1H9B5M6_9ACTN|nr:DUF3592 domain-containing protein [Microlunatus flavus]SEP84244.1 Protein of unknown function [Microlunatus flavus]
MSRRRFPQTIGVVAAVYLAAMAVVFALLSAQNADFVRTAGRTDGTVVALVARAPLGSTRESRVDARVPSLAPKVTYVVDGRTYDYVAAHGRYRQRLQVGDTVTVLYAPGDPASARLRGEGQDSGPFLSVGFGAAAVLLGAVLLKLRRRPGRPSGPADASRGRSPALSGMAD